LTAYLAQHCSSLVLVDIAPNCIEFCRRRFAGSGHVEYFVNDGSSLAFLENDSVDFAFSFDSLVHADRDAVVGYLRELERVLRVGGHAVLHHSNLAALIGGATGAGVRAGDHLRSRDVSADIVAESAARLGSLECRLQELISCDATSRLIDCISTFVRRVPRSGAPVDRVANPDFYQRARELRALSERYAGSPAP
jgi:SAM-dependent methyltransferase